MKIVIFAGGIGSRMWPLSRENSPKQFDALFSGKSTLRLAFERVLPVFGAENIYVQTMGMYEGIVKKQLSELPAENIFLEPARRDVGPAVMFSMDKLKKSGYGGPVAIIWADHIMDHVQEFVSAVKAAEKLIKKDPNRFIFIAEHPRFANNNLGWIKIGEKCEEIENKDCFSFLGWKYKPAKDVCERMFKSGEYFWNPGYFITSVDFLLGCYEKLAPEIFTCVTNGKYEESPKASFDAAIIEKVDLKNAVVIKTNMGWSDPGTLYALKEALEESSEANVEKGNVINYGTSDSLVYNMEDGKIVATVDLKGMVVVNTKDALVVVHKDNVVKITDLLKEMKEKKLDKYL